MSTRNFHNHDIAISRAWEFRPYVAFLDDVGVPWQSTAGRLGLPTFSPDASIFLPTLPYCRFLAEITRLKDFPDLAVRANLDKNGRLHIWQPTPGVMTACLSAPTLYSGLRQICETARTQWTSLRFWLRETEQDIWLCSKSASVSGMPGSEQTEYARVLQTVAMLQRFLGCEWQPREIHLEFNAQPVSLFSELLGGPRFLIARPHTAFPISKTILAAPGPLSGGGAWRLDSEVWATDATQWSALQRLQAILPAYVIGNALTVENLAEIASLHVRTLQRALAAEGLTFRGLVEQARFEVAKDWLADSSMTVGEISQLLGYTEPTNFSRAFRRISGRTPLEYRSDLASGQLRTGVGTTRPAVA